MARRSDTSDEVKKDLAKFLKIQGKDEFSVKDYLTRLPEDKHSSARAIIIRMTNDGVLKRVGHGWFRLARVPRNLKGYAWLSQNSETEPQPKDMGAQVEIVTEVVEAPTRSSLQDPLEPSEGTDLAEALTIMPTGTRLSHGYVDRFEKSAEQATTLVRIGVLQYDGGGTFSVRKRIDAAGAKSVRTMARLFIEELPESCQGV